MSHEHVLGIYIELPPTCMCLMDNMGSVPHGICTKPKPYHWPETNDTVILRACRMLPVL